MPIFASGPATTVRQRSPRLLPKPAYVLVFLTIALAVYGWKSFSSRPVRIEVPPQATAEVRIHDPNFAFQQAWQEVLAQAKREVRENLRMEAQRSGQETVVAISLRNLPAESIAPMVNVVASAYSQACRAEWKLHLEQAYSAAAEKVRQTERQASQAQTQFELLRDRRLRALAAVKPIAPPQPTTIENPRWTEIRRHLADLEERRRVLLFERTPLHPSVQETEMLIADARREIASIPETIAQEPPAAAPAPPSASPPDDGPAAAEVEAAQQAAAQLQEDLRQAQAIERAAQTARGAELHVDLLAAEPFSPPPAPSRDTAPILGKALVTATTSVVGLGMISFGAALEPALSSIAELQALLLAPVVGVIPAAHPGRRRAVSPLGRRLARWGWVTAGLGVLFAVVWMLFRG
jgi:hypothetical protein